MDNKPQGENTEKVDRRAMLAGSILAAITAASMLAEDEAKASIFGEENITLGAILTQLKTTYDHAVKLKKEYYDKHIDKFNEQVTAINDSLENARELYKATLTIQDWSKYLKDERDYAIGFIKKYMTGDFDYTELKLEEYDKRKSALQKILNSQAGIIGQLEEFEENYRQISGSLNEGQKNEIKQKKTLLAIFSNSRLTSDEAEIRLTELRERRRRVSKEIDTISKLDPKEGIALKDSLNLSDIKASLEIQNRLAIRTNDLLEAQIRLQAENILVESRDMNPLGKNGAEKKLEQFRKGNWGDPII